jgi:DNA-binding transcriptional LysR family regulator
MQRKLRRRRVALMAAAIAGLGVVYQPEFIVADAIRRGELQPVCLDVPTRDIGGVHILYSLDHAPPAKVRVMIDFLVAAFTPGPPAAGVAPVNLRVGLSGSSPVWRASGRA